MKKDFLTLLDYSPDEIAKLLDLAKKIKEGSLRPALKDKTLLMLFEKTSTRTRVSFEVAMTELRGHAIYAEFKTTKIAQGETLEDTAKVLSRYCDAIMARLYKHSDIETMAKAAAIPVINGLTDLFHPSQTMADLLTIKEKFGKLDGLKIAFVGDCGFNMAHSTMIGCSKMGMDVNLVCPSNEVYEPSAEIVKKAEAQAKGKIKIIHDPKEGVRAVDVIYTDTWVSPGQEQQREQRIKDFKPFQVNSELVKHAKEKFVFMHCLPAFRGFEVSNDVLDGSHSIVFDEAENRLHVQKAILVSLIK